MLQALLAIAGAGASIYGGISAKNAADDRADLERRQGEILKEEAFRDAAQIRDEGYRFSQQQVMAYISAGVEIQGTPLLLTNETISMSDAEASAAERKGEAQLSLAQASAKITEREGRAKLISSIIGAGTTLGSAYNDGVFK